MSNPHPTTGTPQRDLAAEALAAKIINLQISYERDHGEFLDQGDWETARILEERWREDVMRLCEEFNKRYQKIEAELRSLTKLLANADLCQVEQIQFAVGMPWIAPLTDEQRAAWDEAYKSAPRPKRVENTLRTIACNRCAGTGRYPTRPYWECPRCKGTGQADLTKPVENTIRTIACDMCAHVRPHPEQPPRPPSSSDNAPAPASRTGIERHRCGTCSPWAVVPPESPGEAPSACGRASGRGRRGGWCALCVTSAHIVRAQYSEPSDDRFRNHRTCRGWVRFHLSSKSGSQLTRR